VIKKEKKMIVLYLILQMSVNFQTLSKECFSSKDLSRTSNDYLGLITDNDREFWLFRQGFFYGSGLVGTALMQICFNCNWLWGVLNYSIYGIGIIISIKGFP
jgi:hypothetical protein